MINVGTGVHRKGRVAAIQDGSGRILQRTEFENNRAGIARFAPGLKTAHPKGKIRAVCESTANYWIMVHDIPGEHGTGTALVHPAKTRAMAHAKIKDDRVDAKVLADLLRAGLLAESFVPDKAHRDLRLPAGTRTGKVQEQTRYKNKIHSYWQSTTLRRPRQARFLYRQCSTSKGWRCPGSIRWQCRCTLGTWITCSRR